MCEGTACHVAGAGEVAEELRRAIGIAPGSDTDPARRFTVERVACLGSCSLAPVVAIDERIYGHVSPLGAAALVEEFLDSARRRRNGAARNGTASAGNGAGRSAGRAVEIRVGVGSCGIASGAGRVLEALEEEVRAAGGGAVVKPVGCAGLCHREPMVEVVESGVRRALYGNVTPGDAGKVVGRWVRPRGLGRRALRGVAAARRRLLEDSAWTPVEDRAFEPGPYVSKQVRVVLENCGEIDPASLEEYRGAAGSAPWSGACGRLPRSG